MVRAEGDISVVSATGRKRSLEEAGYVVTETETLQTGRDGIAQAFAFARQAHPARGTVKQPDLSLAGQIKKVCTPPVALNPMLL